jgi:hypothetical protein
MLLYREGMPHAAHENRTADSHPSRIQTWISRRRQTAMGSLRSGQTARTPPRRRWNHLTYRILHPRAHRCCGGFVPRCQLASSTLLSLGTHGGLVAGSGIAAGRIYIHQIPTMGPVYRRLCGNFPALPAFKVGICHRKKFRGHFAGPFLRSPSAYAGDLSKYTVRQAAPTRNEACYRAPCRRGALGMIRILAA